MSEEMRTQVVLIVEDDPAIADVLSIYLTGAGFGIRLASTVVGAQSALAEGGIDVVVLDVGLPDGDGVSVCRAMRERSDLTPILFCTAQDDEVARVLGLESGGDDYITKPFSPREVVARVRAVLRRVASGRESSAPDALLAGDVVLRPAARTVEVSGVPVHLTATEFDLLARLMRTPGIVIARDRLLEEVWGYSNAVPTRTVDVHVAQVRAKLARPDLIETVRGIGYRLRALA